MSILSKLTIKGYKSIQNLENFELKNINILLGENGAGKSNFISVFKFLSHVYDQDFQTYIQVNGGIDTFLYYGRKRTERISMEFCFNADEEHPFYPPCGYKFSIIPAVDDRAIFEEQEIYISNESKIIESGYREIPGSEYPKFIKRAIDSSKVYQFHDTSDTALVKRTHPSNDNLVLKSDAANLAAFLTYLNDFFPSNYQQIVKTIQLVAPYFSDFVCRKNENYSQLEWFEKSDQETPFKAQVLSDGTLRFICLATLLLQPFSKMKDVILIDEPELGLHPYALAVLADLIKRAAEQKQLIISTQSVELINHFSANDIIVVDRVNDASMFKRLDEEQLKDWLEDYTLGDLWKQNILGGRLSS